MEKVEKLFNNENQTTTLGTLGEKGTGYGLPIAGFFLKKLNVQLNILTNKNSELEKGTCFQMVFN